MEVLYILLVFLTALIPGFLSQSLHEKRVMKVALPLGFGLVYLGLFMPLGYPATLKRR